MRVPRTLVLSIAAEIALYTGIGTLAFLVVVTVQNLAQRFEELVAVGLVWGDTLQLLGSLLPVVGAYSIPVGFLFGVLVTIGRMSADSEVTAMRACGLGIGALVTPALVLAIAASALTAVLMIRIEPDARRTMRAVLAGIASRGGILEPGRFRNIGDRMLYVQARDTENHLSRVLVADRSDPERPFLIFAERGRFHFDEAQLLIRLELENGDLHLESTSTDRHRRIAFERADYAIEATALIERNRAMKPREMNLSQLADSIRRSGEPSPPPEIGNRNPREFSAHYHRRLALPFAPLVFAALGVPLGLRRTRGARSWGVLVCGVLVGLYYLMLTAGQFLGEQGAVPVVVGLWLPNVAFAAAAIALLRRAQRGES